MSVLLEQITVALMPTAPTQMKPSHVLANQDFKATEHPVLVIKDSDNLNSTKECSGPERPPCAK